MSKETEYVEDHDEMDRQIAEREKRAEAESKEILQAIERKAAEAS